MVKKKKKSKDVEIQTETIEEEEEVVEKSNEIKFECPVCKKMLEMQNELIIKKKGDCQCKCVPFTFKVSKSDKSMTIDKTKDGDINVETDIHNITFKWGKQITPTENETTLETVKCIVDK